MIAIDRESVEGLHVKPRQFHEAVIACRMSRDGGADRFPVLGLVAAGCGFGLQSAFQHIMFGARKDPNQQDPASIMTSFCPLMQARTATSIQASGFAAAGISKRGDGGGGA